jgi:hypothetical protein
MYDVWTKLKYNTIRQITMNNKAELVTVHYQKCVTSPVFRGFPRNPGKEVRVDPSIKKFNTQPLSIFWDNANTVTKQ